MKHSIDSVSFKNNWTINNVTVAYNSDNLKLVLNPTSLDTFMSAPGYNIYSLIVPIVSNNVLISASGTLSEITGRIL